MRYLTFLAVLIFCASSLFAGESDFNAELQQAATKLRTLMPQCSTLMDNGDFAGANAKLLAAFPEGSRTAAQSFMLGNVLFELDRKQSYAMHKAAADLEPEQPDVIYEFALEQHRAGEYAAALASYEKYAKAAPQWALTYALQADCLLRLNRIKDAAAAWKKSEDAPRGDLESMESIICAVHREPTPHARRAELLAKAVKDHAVAAAEELIALDCDFQRDWWNGGVHEVYLNNDLPAVLKALALPPDDLHGRAIACAAEVAKADPEQGQEIRKSLEKHRLLIDKDQTIPENAGLLSILVPAATRSKVIDSAALLKLHPKFLELARKNKDARLWNVAAFAGVEQDQAVQMKVEREAWQATADARFAVAVLLMKSKQADLKTDDADLLAAVKQFPENGVIQRARLEAAMRENKVTLEMWADGARAEFTHFSNFVAPATVVNRPRANYLRQYFAQMRKIIEGEKGKKDL